jgi:predicted dehydrogenase
MNDLPSNVVPRRTFLKRSAKVAVASALAGVVIPTVHAGEDNTIRLAVIGCGGRGTGAVGNALSTPFGPVKLYAMADLFSDRLTGSYNALRSTFGDAIGVPPERQFASFDAYKPAIDCLRPGDIALLTTHAGFRAMHLEYAVQKGVNVFMEKSFAPDPGSTHQILQAGALAEKKGLKIACGLMCRHSTARQAMIQKIRDGEMGSVQFIRAFRMAADGWLGMEKPDVHEILWQIRRAYNTFWVSSGNFLDSIIHLVDECCWIKDAWPVSAQGLGGRLVETSNYNQNFDCYSIEYTFADGTKAFVDGRFAPNCYNEFATYVHGTKCAGQFSGCIHAPAVHIYKNQQIAAKNLSWKAPREKVAPHQAEWNVLIDAIRNNRPHNEASRAAHANFASLMGRAAVHTGKVVTWDEMMASKFRFCPNVATLTNDSPAPVQVNAQGRYPLPSPGSWVEI